MAFPLLGSLLTIGAGLIGKRMDDRQGEENTAAQNAAARRAATVAYQRDNRTMTRADRMSDRNAAVERAFNVRQAKLAWERTDEAALRNRRWAKADVAGQFDVLRAAAKRAGFNPLTALGSGASGVAGGLSSSSYGAASGAGAASVSGFASSVPMTYGAPISPLASNEAIMGGLSEFGREVSGVAAQERANAQVFNDIARIELERMQGGMVAPSVPSLGRNTSLVGNMRSSDLSGSGDVVWSGDPWIEGRYPGAWRPTTGIISGGRPEEMQPTENIGGFMNLEGGWTGGPIPVPGSDGEVMGVNEQFGALPWLGLGLYNNYIGEPFADWVMGGMPTRQPSLVWPEGRQF